LEEPRREPDLRRRVCRGLGAEEYEEKRERKNERFHPVRSIRAVTDAARAFWVGSAKKKVGK